MTEHTHDTARLYRLPWVGQRDWLRRRRGVVRRMAVVGQAPVTERMRRVSLVSEDMEDFHWIPGQDMVLELPLASGETARRHYTIRHFDEAEQRVDIDFVLHGDGASARWLERVQIGDRLIAMGPRGHVVPAQGVDMHLFLGDETCIPAIAAMAARLKPSARAVALIEVKDEADEQPITSPADLTLGWLCRRDAPAGSAHLLLKAAEALTFNPLNTHAYVIGETSQVRAVRHHLIDRGLPKARISAEGYWRPGRIGGHDHL
jgi:NADPH-dependent ferric siderophore reductase